MHDFDSEQVVTRHFGDRVRARRDTLAISQRRLSELIFEQAGIRLYPSGVTRIETGQREPKLTEAVAIAQVLGVRLDELIPDTETPAEKLAAASELAVSWAEKARRASAELAGQYVGVHRIFAAHPDLLSEHSFGSSHRKAKTPDEFLELIRDGIEANAKPLVELVVDARARDLIVAIVEVSARSAIAKQVGEP